METRILGNTGMEVSRLGIGLAAIGFEETFDTIKTVEVVLKTALDQGITFFDTAECYFYSEEMVGHSISDRRSEFFLATKCGHPHPPTATGEYEADWSFEGISLSIDRSLKRLKTDYVDLFQLHSCSVEVLEQGEVIEALTKARDAGKTRYIGYSGDNEAADWAVGSGHFDTLQTSFNLADQRPRNGLLKRAKENGLGVIAKRPIANTAWGADTSPTAGNKYDPNYGDEYWKRTLAMAALGPIEIPLNDRILMSLGFVMSHEEIATAIVGTRNPEHLKSNIDLCNSSLPIDKSVVTELYRRWDELDDNWIGQI
jgi:aryl-alcohol dehydrogenase-like predicted oxidoreductase